MRPSSTLTVTYRMRAPLFLCLRTRWWQAWGQHLSVFHRWCKVIIRTRWYMESARSRARRVRPRTGGVWMGEFTCDPAAVVVQCSVGRVTNGVATEYAGSQTKRFCASIQRSSRACMWSSERRVTAGWLDFRTVHQWVAFLIKWATSYRSRWSAHPQLTMLTR